MSSQPSCISNRYKKLIQGIFLPSKQHVQKTCHVKEKLDAVRVSTASRNTHGYLPKCLRNSKMMDISLIVFVCLMVFNTTFNNSLAISRRSVLLVGETAGPKENHWPVASHWQTWSHNVVHLALIKIWTHIISDDRH